MEFFFGAFTTEWAQKRAALLHEMSLGSNAKESEESLFKYVHQIKEVRRGGGGGGSKGKPIRLPKMQFPRISTSSAKSAGAGRSMETRLTSVAKGSQPAVVKMASYGAGARVGSMLNYVSRGGELKVENENGEKLQGREDLARVRGDWDHLFQNRTESRDIGSFAVEVAAGSSAEELHERVRSVLSSGFGDRRYAYAVEERADGSMRIEGHVVLRSGQGERLTADAKSAGIVQKRFDASAVAGVASASFSFSGYGNGVDYGAAKVRDLIERRDEVRDDRGRVLTDEKAASDLVQKEWRDELHSRKSRDVMHVIMSARAGTDAAAFEGAVRDFLADQFAGHRYVFAMHDPETDTKEAGEGGKRPHVHAHAIVTMRSEAGDRVETTPATFRQWREVMAEKARAHGINMEMTDRREFASAPAYTRNQVRAVNRDGRTEHVGTSEPAQARYDAKRSGRRNVASSQRSRQYSVKAQETWQKVAAVAGDRQTVAYAAEFRDTLQAGLADPQAFNSGTVISADFGGDYRANMVALNELISEAEDMREQTRPEFEAYEKNVEMALFKLERSAGTEDRASYEEVAEAAREFVNLRRELVEINEREALRANGGLTEQVAEESGDRVERPASTAEAETAPVQVSAVPRDEASDNRADADDASRYDKAVDKHGEATVEAGNEKMMNVEHYREGIARVEAGEFSETDLEGFKAGLDRSLRQAAETAVAGNDYLRDIAKDDPELKAKIEELDREDGRAETDTTAKTPATTDVVDERQRDLQAEIEDERGSHNDEREAHELADTIEATQKQQDRVNKEREILKGGETTRTDPAQQHVPRLEELEREQTEQRERDRDDRDR
ncbi:MULTISPECIES: conjugal transfer protein TraA [Agrobacterium]|uniref:conjugal transfer protein TraA n=1 Tax=Agrobacterium TaxID=357 RepID=UPI0009BBDA9E|nr:MULTISPECIES: conjugal transfer protein TraA [Agrobacterium]QCL77453.1 conjugal transfer protein TraA [Agrobacterium tumefaciens]CUX72307.1 Ti-type conjugative transfer relaxase TraA [Agrobacterium sp. NCPPB 925]